MSCSILSATRRSETSRAGFTLLEVLVATAILGIVLTTVYGVLSRAIIAKNHSEERAELYAAGREAALRIADELEGALPPTAGNNVVFVGAPGSGAAPADSVQFVAVVRREFPGAQSRGGRALVSYSLDPVQSTPGLFALRRQEQLLTEPAPDETTDDSGMPAPPPMPLAAYVLDQVAGLRFRYLDPQSGGWVDHWDTAVQVAPGDVPPTLPGAVDVRLFLADADGGIHDFGTIVDLPLMALAPTPRR